MIEYIKASEVNGLTFINKDKNEVHRMVRNFPDRLRSRTRKVYHQINTPYDIDVFLLCDPTNSTEPDIVYMNKGYNILSIEHCAISDMKCYVFYAYSKHPSRGNNYILVHQQAFEDMIRGIKPIDPELYFQKIIASWSSIDVTTVHNLISQADSVFYNKEHF